MDIATINTALQGIIRLIGSFRSKENYYRDISLSEVTKLTRVEPLMVISKECMSLDYFSDIAQFELALFSGYYLQAISLLTKVNDVEVAKILDRLNPDRDETALMMSVESLRTMSMENYRFALPGTVAMENDKDKAPVQTVNELAAFSVGKLLNVTLDYNKSPDEFSAPEKKSVTVPISVRLIASSLTNAAMINILASKTEDATLTERYHAWRAGRISFIRDFIFAQDLIDESKRAMIGDETGTIQEIIRRVNNSKRYGLLTQNPSLVSASNIFVFTEATARDLEMKLGGPLKNAKIREKAFNNTYAMIITVIDREREIVTFYIRGINTPSELTVRELKVKSKGSGPDITDVLKSITMGAAPVF